jgi:molybdopterin synthase catalytic subunit
VFSLSVQAINSDELGKKLCSSEAGAFVSFEGRVRNHNEGRAVLRLEYEAYAAMAKKEADIVLAETRQLFPVIDLACVHRVGLLEIGEIAVWVGVIARHRAEAFDACRYVIDQIKARVPIWKKEYYVDGSTTWVNCAECASHAHADPTGQRHKHEYTA